MGENNGRVYGLGGTLSTSGPGFGISADFVYDSNTGESGVLITPSAGVSTGQITFDVLIGGKDAAGNPVGIKDFTGPGGQISVAFGAQAGVVTNQAVRWTPLVGQNVVLFKRGSRGSSFLAKRPVVAG